MGKGNATAKRAGNAKVDEERCQARRPARLPVARRHGAAIDFRDQARLIYLEQSFRGKAKGVATGSLLRRTDLTNAGQVRSTAQPI